MKNYKVQLIFAVVMALLFHGVAKAEKGGSSVGNGGDAVVCRNQAGAITSAELLDFYEARTLRQTAIDLGDEAEDYKMKAVALIDRLTKKSPSRGTIYSKWYGAFESELLFLSNTELTDIPDSLHSAMPRGCKVEQVVIQQVPVHPEDKRYLISNDIWSKLPNSSKAGLILHELFFREAIETHSRLKSEAQMEQSLNSIDVRYVNALLASNKIGSFNLKQWNELITSTAFFKYVEVDGLSDLIFLDIEKEALSYNSEGTSVSKWYSCCSFKAESDTYSGALDLKYRNFLIHSRTLNSGLTLTFDGTTSSAFFDQDYYTFSFNRMNDGMLALKTANTRDVNRINRIVVDRSLDFKAYIQRSNEGGPFIYQDPFNSLAPRCQTWSFNQGQVNASMEFSESKKRLTKIVLNLIKGANICGIQFPALYPWEKEPIVLNFDDNGAMSGNSPIPYYSASSFDLGEASLNGKYIAVNNTVISVLGEKIPAVKGSKLIRDEDAKSFSFTTKEAFSICKNDHCRRGCTQYAAGSEVTITDAIGGAVCR